MYGEKLYNHKHFSGWFSTFRNDQASSAQLIWQRVLEKCGKDQDLPSITQIVDYGCGEGTFLKCLHQVHSKARSEDAQVPAIQFRGLDCCEKAIERAKLHESIKDLVAKCDPNPEKALGSLFADPKAWSTTALLVMGHSWFHFDQESLIKTILTLRPAIILVDVYQSWNDVVRRLAAGAQEEMEHGRRFETGSTYWLRTEKREGNAKVNRGIYHIPPQGEGQPGWEFVTTQTPKTTEDLFGGLSFKPDKSNAGTILERARTSGDLVETTPEGRKFCAYVHDRQYLHNTGWGPMECHVLVALNPIARILNRAWFKTISALISDAVIQHAQDKTSGLARMMRLFDDATVTGNAHGSMPGSREALVLLPFEPNAIFAHILPLHAEQDLTISQYPLLVEHPTRWQTQFPSANGVFQTCLGHSSSAQAFPTGWAHDYDLTVADQALEELELGVLGLTEQGIWGMEEQPASYFMVPFYRGSLPLFCLALKFPQHFAPETTDFDVYQSTIKSLHDAIQTSLTDDKVRLQVIRPWVEGCLTDKWPLPLSMQAKLDMIEELLFGAKTGNTSGAAYSLGEEVRCCGVLAKKWKAWVLGLPSFPINKMSKVIEENRRLWQIWKKEKEIALLDPALRISLWFQEGRFFEDKAHEEFVCSVHLPRLSQMFSDLGWKDCSPAGGADWCPSKAVDWLEMNYSNDNSDIVRYFGKENTKHFLFRWLIQQLNTLANGMKGCHCQEACYAAGSSAACSCAAKEPFHALKAVFCKTNANTGPGMRFDLTRLWHLLDSARSKDNLSPKGELEPSALADLGAAGRQLPSKFWSKDDPSIHIAELVQCLARMGLPNNPSCIILDKIQLSIQEGVTVALSIKIALKDNVGGSDKHKLDQCAEKIRKHCALGDIHNTKKINIHFSITPEGEFKPVT